MKKILLSLALVAGGTFIFTGCSKDDDTTAPIITLLGDNPYTITAIGDNFVEPGYTATDEEDGDLTSQVNVDLSELDEDMAGSYEIHYEVSDESGNVADVHREVDVLNAADFLKGTFGALIQCPGFADYNYTDQVKMDLFVNNKIIFGKFGDYAGAEDDVYANVTQVSGTFVAITIPTQTVNCGTPAADRTFNGTGTISVVGTTVTMVIQVTESIPGQSPITCTYTYTRS